MGRTGTTGSATTIGLMYPELNGKLNGIAMRVPLLNASLTDCVFEVSRPTTVDEVNRLFQKAADGPHQAQVAFVLQSLFSVRAELVKPRAHLCEASVIASGGA